MKNSLVRFVAVGVALLSVLVPSQDAHAEGGYNNVGLNAFGVNRRVSTDTGPSGSVQLADGSTLVTGWVGIAGRFTVPTLRLASRWERTRSKPTFYLGSRSGDAVVDAGVQWEPETFNTSAGPVGPGWAIFMNANGPNDTSPRTLDSKGAETAWRSNPTSEPLNRVNPGVTSFSFIYRIHQGGGVSLYASALGADYQPANFYTTPTRAGYEVLNTFYWGPVDNGKTPVSVYQADQLPGMTMKRVIGITQGGVGNITGPQPPPGGNGVYTLDNSEMIGCTFSGGTLGVAQQKPGGGLNYGFSTFLAGNVDQDTLPTTGRGTGYAPGGPNSKDGKGNWIVDFNFPGIGSRDSLGLFRDVPTAARYETSETVDIHLRNSSPVQGQLVVPGIPRLGEP